MTTATCFTGGSNVSTTISSAVDSAVALYASIARKTSSACPDDDVATVASTRRLADVTFSVMLLANTPGMRAAMFVL